MGEKGIQGNDSNSHSKTKDRGKRITKSMRLALESINSGHMTRREASRFYNILESTIRSWKRKKVTSRTRGPPTVLKQEEEIALVKWC